MHWGAAFEEQVRFFRLAFQQEIEFPPHQSFLFLLADLALDSHQVLATMLNLTGGKLLIQSVRVRPLLVGVGEGSHPIKSSLAHKRTQVFEFLFSLSRKAHDEGCTQGEVWNFAAHLADRAEK